MSEITREMLEAFSGAFQSSAKNQVAKNAVVKSGLSAAAENLQEQIDNPMTFSIEIETGKITNQKQSGRCWLFAALNCMRFEVMKKLNLETFELSQNYQMFWDKLEKANFYLDSVIATADEARDSRLIAHLLSSPEGDGGQWDMYCAIADKYGCVPKYAMPETFQSSQTGMMVKLITLKLREDAKLLRAAVKEGKDAGAMKTEMLGEIYRILVVSLGEPPKTFTFEYRDKDKNFHRDADITPRVFYEKYVGLALSDYVSIINAPTADKPYYKTFTVEYLGNVVGGRPVKYLNLPAGDMRELAIKQMSDGEPVWFGCDVGQMLLREQGIMGMNTFDYENLLDVKFGLDKAGRWRRRWRGRGRQQRHARSSGSLRPGTRYREESVREHAAGAIVFPNSGSSRSMKRCRSWSSLPSGSRNSRNSSARIRSRPRSSAGSRKCCGAKPSNCNSRCSS